MVARKKKPESPKLDGVYDEIFTMQIEPEEVFHLVEEMAKAHDEDGETSWYTQVGILAERYPNDSVRCICIMERMQCLIALGKDKRMRGWSMDTDDPKCTLTHQAVFRATAKARIYRKGKKLRFDPDEFFALTLNETPAEGNA